MLTPEQAQAHATRHIEQYISDCKLESADQLGDVLMMLVSVTGCLMAKSVGRDDAVQRLLGVAQYVNKTMPAEPALLVPVQ